jgi:hypothetical protein
MVLIPGQIKFVYLRNRISYGAARGRLCVFEPETAYCKLLQLAAGLLGSDQTRNSRLYKSGLISGYHLLEAIGELFLSRLRSHCKNLW